MTEGPLSLTGPQPEIRVRDGERVLRPSLAGYVLHSHSEYQIDIAVGGLSNSQWRVQHGRKPPFLDSVSLSPAGDDAYVLSIATQRTASGLWSWLSEFGADLPLTIVYGSANNDDYNGASDGGRYPPQSVKIPLVPGRPWISVAMFCLSTISTIAWWIVVESPKSAPQWLPAHWTGRLTIALSCVVVLTLAFVIYRWIVQPWLRYVVLRKRALELLE
jgi:hypothetical protein